MTAPLSAAHNLKVALAVLTAMCSLFSLSVEAQDRAASPAEIPVETFAALPGFSGARFSPDGKTMAFLAASNGAQDVVVRQLATSEGMFRIPAPGAATFQQLRWANNDVVLVQVTLTANRKGFERRTTESRWFSFDLTTRKFIWLGKPKLSQHELASQLERIVDILPEDDDHILLQLDLNLNGDTEVYKTNIRTGARRLRRPPVDGVQNWYTDHTSDVRLGTGYKGARWVTKLKDKSGFWTDLAKAEWGSELSVSGFSSDPNILYVKATSPHGTQGLYTLDLKSESIQKTLFEREDVDVDYAITDPRTNEIFAVGYTDDFSRVQYLDPQRQKVKQAIDKALPDTVNTILREVKGKRWYFLRAENDRNDGSYYMFNAKSQRLQKIADRRPDIDPDLMAEIKRVSIKVRDGSTIDGYLSLPHGAAHKSMPAIIMPHGGPLGVRDTAHWDYMTQFFASRGYLTLMPNYRGSGGYGQAFEKMGEKQWGGLMQDDLTDATHWLINEGYADPDRICIVGGSYGGYAALMGTIKERGLYRCAISLNGVTDLVKLKSEDRKYSIGGRSWVKTMGLEGASDNTVSPYHRAANVSAPVLLIAAEDDARVPWEMSRDMHKRLQKLGKDSSFVSIKEGTHYMVSTQARLTALTAAEAFLAKHIGDDF